MIDHDDGDAFWLAGLFSPGLLALVLLVCAIVFWVIAASNEKSCASLACTNSQTPKLMENECLCVEKAR